MDKDSYLHGYRKGLQESVDYFASQDKFMRESWVVDNFLTNLSIIFDKSELIPGNNLPDVIFRQAQFEVKEILDQDRKRHKDYKIALDQSKAAIDPVDLIKMYSPKETLIYSPTRVTTVS